MAVYHSSHYTMVQSFYQINWLTWALSQAETVVLIFCKNKYTLYQNILKLLWNTLKMNSSPRFQNVDSTKSVILVHCKYVHGNYNEKVVYLKYHEKLYFLKYFYISLKEGFCEEFWNVIVIVVYFFITLPSIVLKGKVIRKSNTMTTTFQKFLTCSVL